MITKNSWQCLTLLYLAAAVVGCTKLSERTHARYDIGTPGKVRPAEPGVAGVSAAVAGLLAMNILFNSVTGSDTLWLWPGGDEACLDGGTPAADQDGKNPGRPDPPKPASKSTDRDEVSWASPAKVQP
ncbi:hypothetical protein [Humisphaera borealis]|uniref:Lipoprotein n=1 Tax=Humisphaera borealis TaxID=2807512 RepID=A0A7M2WWT1_9BACT|nr:hypothetical protein [Humisphaera borealis]QOV89291.1 hypothetical protein IPV69_24295 [Humisphaera borealis]